MANPGHSVPLIETSEYPFLDTPAQVLVFTPPNKHLRTMFAWAKDKKVREFIPSILRDDWGIYSRWWWFNREKRPAVRFDWLIFRYRRWRGGLQLIGHSYAVSRADGWDVGLLIGETKLWGKGFGRAALGKVLERVKEVDGGIAIYAVIHPFNERAIRLFTSCGFVKVGPAHNGQEKYEYNVPAHHPAI